MAITAPPTIDALPTPPDPNDRSTFNTRAYPWSVAQQTLATQLAAVASNVHGNATEAQAQATAAASSATTATTKAGDAQTSATASAASATSAAGAATSAINAFDQFDTRYLGAKASDPSTDNDGGALLAGALYYKTGDGMRVWDGGAWQTAYVPTTGVLTSGDIGSTVQAYDADLTAWAGKTAPTGSAVGTTDVQTLTNKTLNAPAISGGAASGITLNDGYTEEVFAVSGTTPALSPTNGSIQTWTLTGNSTPTAGTWASGQSITLMIDDGTAYTVTWTSLAVTWKTNTGSAPTLNTSGYTVIQLWKVGTTIYGARVGDA